MAVTLFVWGASALEGSIGHAALATQSPQTYISWWPGPSGKTAKLVVTDGAKMERISIDIRTNEKRAPTYASAPITGLDENAIAEHWRRVSAWRIGHSSFTKPTGKADKYDLISRNCSSMVLECLVAGGLYKAYPFARFSMAGVATPAKLQALAEEISEFRTGDRASFSWRMHFNAVVMKKY